MCGELGLSHTRNATSGAPAPALILNRAPAPTRARATSAAKCQSPARSPIPPLRRGANSPTVPVDLRP